MISIDLRQIEAFLLMSSEMKGMKTSKYCFVFPFSFLHLIQPFLKVSIHIFSIHDTFKLDS